MTLFNDYPLCCGCQTMASAAIAANAIENVRGLEVEAHPDSGRLVYSDVLEATSGGHLVRIRGNTWICDACVRTAVAIHARFGAISVDSPKPA